MKISDFNNYVDLSNSDGLSGLLLKTSNQNQIYEENLIPSVESVVFLKNKYEVLEVTEDYQGTLENLMKMKGKKVPKTLPFINVLLVGGGSSGGWAEMNNDSTAMSLFSGTMAGETKLKTIRNIKLNDNIEIKIGKGGESIPEYLLFHYDNWEDIQISANEGHSSYFYYNQNEIISNGGKYVLNPNTNEIDDVNSHNGIFSFKQKNTLPIIDTDTSWVDNYSLDISNFILKNGYYISLLNNQFYYIPHSFQKLGGVYYDLFLSIDGNSQRGQRTGQFLSIGENCDILLKVFLDNIKEQKNNAYKMKMPDWYNNRDPIVSEYGIVGHGSLRGAYAIDEPFRAVFFSGLDSKNYGTPGLPGDYTKMAFYTSDNEYNQFFQHRGYCGKGGDGVCYIYYPSEV